MHDGKGERAVSLERRLLSSPDSGRVTVQDMGPPSVSPQQLGREWIEQQEMVLLGEAPSQNGDSRLLTVVGTGPSSNLPSRGWGGG